ncbi:MAG TPA: hypothetical protein VLA89_13460 [Gemmatimonadales bacterium]|nr:hypothetical protein [Gemmatimonadales bacterium]
MQKEDKFIVELLPNGLFKVTTDEISGPNHMTAEAFIDFLARGAGGEVTRSRREDRPMHSHGEHTHTHTHEH